MTNYPCVSGTFIGVDSYGRGAPSKAILSAGSDARRIHSYFASAHPSGVWTALTSGAQQSVRRIDMLDAVHRWIKGVERDEAGLLYFGGHGVVTEQGLTLAAEDFVHTLPVDSGVTLRRIIELITQHGRSDRRYVLMLDCCREVDNTFSPEAVTSNISILYACSIGEPAIEVDSAGAYSSAVLAWLDQAEPIEFGTALYCRLDSAVNTIRSLIKSRLGEEVQIPEQFGADAHQILIPKHRRWKPNSLYDKGPVPRVCLRTGRMDGEQLQLAYREISLICFQFSALTLDNFDDSVDICHITNRGEIEIWFDFVDRTFDYSAFFDFIMSKSGDLLFDLEFYWNRSLSESDISEISTRCHLHRVAEAGSTSVLFWEAGERTHGRLRFDRWVGFGTRARIDCRRIGRGPSYSIANLLPQLSFVFRRLVDAGDGPRLPVVANFLEIDTKLDPAFVEYCRFAEAALAAKTNPTITGFRGKTDRGLGAALGHAILREFWLLMCTSDKRYADIRSKASKSNKAALAAISAFIAGKYGIEMGAVTAAVSAISIVISRAGSAAMCQALSSAS